VAAERRALRDDSPWRRELAARRVGLLRSESSRRALRRALGRGPAMVTLAAAMSLARDRDGAALRWLISHPQALARRTPRALVTLLRAFGPAALPVLVHALDEGRLDPALERAAIEALGLSGDRDAAEAIERRLQSRDVELRVAAARALGRLRDRESVPALIVLLSDREWQARAQAAWALGQMRDLETIDALAERLTDRAWWVRRHAAYALDRLGARGRAALEWTARRSPDPYARDMASEVLEGGFGPAVGA
jgi:HEAT repeat protein